MSSSGKQDAASTTGEGKAIRLNKALARAGLCSRRAADDLIVAGAVTVNGTVINTPGIRVDPATDHVLVHGREIRLDSAHSSDHLYLALHKPPDVVTTAHDPQGRKTVLDLLPPAIRSRRPFPVGRLDLLSEGLLLLTTDGELALRMTHPRWEHPKVYLVRVRGRVTPEKLATMLSGMRLAEGDQLAPVRARVIEARSPQALDNAVTLEMTLHQGVNRQIRRMCRDLRLHILRLQRISQGPIRLEDLPSGASRPLTNHELQALRASLALSPEPDRDPHREPS